jgi:protein-tyrosine phosphatase
MKNIVNVNNQLLSVSTISNARELGGYKTLDGKTVCCGKLFRSGALTDASLGDIAFLKEKYRLFAIIDMRASYETATDPEPTWEGIQSYRCKILDEQLMEQRTKPIADILMDASADPIKKMVALLQSGIVSDKMYVEFLHAKTGKEGYREFFSILLHAPEDSAVLWHCTHGKDRTGVAAMLLLGTLNVDEETIMEDFLLTNVFFAERIDATRKHLCKYIQDQNFLEELLVVDRGVCASYMQNALRYIKEHYGDITGYVKAELGLSESDIAKLRFLYTK